jgi:hypothetical protein
MQHSAPGTDSACWLPLSIRSISAWEEGRARAKWTETVRLMTGRRAGETGEQALAVASDMRAQCTVLTHFSQRYPHAVEPPGADHIDDGGGDGRAGSTAAPYCVAFDGMHLPSSMFPHVSVVLQATLLALRDDGEATVEAAS